VLRAGEPAVAQAGVLGGSPVQLKNGLARTKAKADLGAGGAPPLYPGFIPGGSDDLRWAAKSSSRRVLCRLAMTRKRGAASWVPGPSRGYLPSASDL